MWDDLNDFLNTVRKSYRRNVWETQDNYIVVWLEKDALSGIFEGITHKAPGNSGGFFVWMSFRYQSALLWRRRSGPTTHIIFLHMVCL
jgi:hypothetical protein